jgi:hypothetical protein
MFNTYGYCDKGYKVCEHMHTRGDKPPPTQTPTEDMIPQLDLSSSDEEDVDSE